MKVAFFVYPSAFQNKGGGEIVLEKTEEYLKKEGIEVVRFNTWDDKIEDFDILHVFGSVKECLPFMRVAKDRKTKIVLESIFWSDYRRAFHEEGSVIEKAEKILRHTVKRVLPFFPSGRKKMFEIADIIFPNSLNEAKQISRLFAISMDKMFVIPNGVDISFSQADPENFVNKYSLKDFVLSVGRIEPRKNQLNLIRAMKEVDRDLVLVGDTVSGYEWYRQLCEQEATSRVHFLNGFEHGSDMLLSAYAAADTFVLPGWFETPGLAALEAALAGAKVVATNGGSTKEYFKDYVFYFDPKNVLDLRRKIEDCSNIEKSQKLREYISETYLWEKVAKKTIEGYKVVLSK